MATDIVGGSSDRASKVQRFAQLWDKHQPDRLDLVQNGYPLALAACQRSAQAPAIREFGGNYMVLFLRDQMTRGDLIKPSRFNPSSHAEEKILSNLTVLRSALAYARTLQDTTPVVDNLTVNAMARQNLSFPEQFAMARQSLASVERGVFSDAAAEAKVESLNTTGEMVDYLQTNFSRYEQMEQRTAADLPWDPALRDYHAQLMYISAVDSLAINYAGDCLLTPDEIEQQFSTALSAKLDLPLVQEASRDDPDARRILTELKETELALSRRKIERAVLPSQVAPDPSAP